MTNKYLLIYLYGWVFTSFLTFYLIYRNRKTLSLLSNYYFSQIMTKWKIVSYIIAVSSIIIMAPYTGDPTWDYIDAGFMAILTVLTAPWAIGTLYLCIQGKTTFKETYIAFCLMMFSSSWSYDGYLLLRDGYYPHTWLPNIFASGVLYIAAGLLWSLEHHGKRGVIFSFMSKDWLTIEPADPSFQKIAPYTFPFFCFAIVALGSFLLHNF